MAAKTSPGRLEADVRREQLVRTVYEVMAREGVHRVPLQQIADESGVSKGLLLYHFATKDAMVLAAMEWVLEATAARIRERIEGAEPDELIARVLGAIWIDPEANLDFFRFYLDGVEHLARSPRFAQFGERNRQVINGLYVDVIRIGVEAGVFNVTDVENAAIQMRSVMDGTFLQWLQTEDVIETHAEYRDLCQRSLEAVFLIDP